MQGTPEGVEDNGSLTRVAAFPIGIDPERFQRALERVDVRSHIAELLNRYAGRKVRTVNERTCNRLACLCYWGVTLELLLGTDLIGWRFLALLLACGL